MTRNEILQAIIDGKQLQVLCDDGEYLNTADVAVLYELGLAGNEQQFRIKPTPKQDIVSRHRFGLNSTVVTICDGETGRIEEVAQVGKPSPSKMEALLREMHGAYMWRDKIDEVLNDLTK